ncbi:MAG: hypothetical protein NTU79_22655 [Planctomycetota bacterium]|nr:hypothetical protein [Planctomycetota bacterium]
MSFGLRSNCFAGAFAIALSTGLTFEINRGAFADESVRAVNEMTSSNPYLNQLFSQQWVRLNQDNSVSGNLVQLSTTDRTALPGLPVALVRNGEVAYRAVADESGKFQFKNVETGSYSLVTRTNETIAAFSVQVLDSANTHLPSEVEVRVVRPAGLKVKEILLSQTLPKYAVPIGNAAVVSKDPLGDSRSFSESYVVKAEANGDFLGQLGSFGTNQNFSDMQVYILKDGEEVGRTRVGKDGKFRVKGLAPDVYGFIAAGDSGFAATSFQLINSSTASVAPDGSRFVGFGKACGQMNVEVVPCCEVVSCEQSLIVEQPIVEDSCDVPVDQCGKAPQCGCGGSWGGGGGGGGSGMGQGWGGIAAIGGLAIVAGILASNDKNNDVPIASPITR